MMMTMSNANEDEQTNNTINQRLPDSCAQLVKICDRA